jgi:hypothetical protein
MRKITLVLLLSALVGVVPRSFAKTHRDMFLVSCDALWPVVKNVIRNSGKYGVIGIDNTEMTISYNIGGFVAGKRINSLVLNRQGENSCEMQVQTSFSGLAHNDEGDLKKRVEAALARESTH